MNNKEKGKYVGLLGALLLHAGVVALLWWITVRTPVPQEEGGLAVALGNVSSSMGEELPEGLVDVDVMSQESAPESDVVPAEESELITQEQEETVAVPEQKKPEQKKEESRKPEKPEKTAAEKEAEARRLEAERLERERKAAAEAAANRVAGAFGKGADMNKGTTETAAGAQGSSAGNSQDGADSGEGVGGSYELSGRKLGPGGLPKPTYTVQEDGKVVVSILVAPSGKVIKADIHRETNTMNATLRKAALEAARKARFNSISGVDNQEGKITYNFKLK